MTDVSFDDFGKQLNVILSGASGEGLDKELAVFAKRTLGEVIASGRASPIYDRYVNHRLGAPEEAVKAPGPILYVFSNWRIVIVAALAELQKRVPKKSGRYADSFLVVSDGRVVADYSTIRPDASVMILNHRPYTRKMESGANGPGRRHFENAKVALNTRFAGVFSVTTAFQQVGGKLHPDMPYILRRSNRRRKDSQAGMPITYPSLLIEPFV